MNSRRTYHIESWTDADDFLGQIAHRGGRLGKGAEPDLAGVAKMVLNVCSALAFLDCLRLY